MDKICLGKHSKKIKIFPIFHFFRTQTKLIKRLDERIVIMKKIGQKRHQLGEMILKGCYVKELQKGGFDLQELLNEAEQLNINDNLTNTKEEMLEKYPENIENCKKIGRMMLWKNEQNTS
jgi:hypothetical protein